MSSALLMLAIHQDVQDKVVEEMNSIFNGREIEIDSSNINDLKYLDLVIKETLRLFPVAPIIGRNINEDLTLDGDFITA